MRPHLPSIQRVKRYVNKNRGFPCSENPRTFLLDEAQSDLDTESEKVSYLKLIIDIARALFRNSRTLLLDEATSDLDTESKKQGLFSWRRPRLTSIQRVKSKLLIFTTLFLYIGIFKTNYTVQE
jgi:hypothetical protein